MIDLKVHYLELIVDAFFAVGLAALHRPDPGGSESKGVVYFCAARKDGGPTTTKSEIVAAYEFGPERFVFAAQFRDARTPFKWTGSYQDGLDAFWPELRKAISGNRIEDHSGKEDRKAA